MNRINLHEEFILALNEKIPNKKQRVDLISDILKIEKEPAARRLSGKVFFSIQQMGIIANELGILLDSLMRKDKRYRWIPFMLESPMSLTSMDSMHDLISQNVDMMLHVSQKPTTLGTIIHSLPLEIYVDYPILMKFMFFKWGHYFIGNEEFNSFSNWKIPDKLSLYKDKMDRINEKIESALYIWDSSLIWTLTGEINYLHKMHVISTEEKKQLKDELKQMLDQLEKYLRRNFISEGIHKNVSFYVSHVNIGQSSLYLFSDVKQVSFLQNSFSFSQPDESYENFINIKNWINSFKNISVLISGSGSLERRLFFKEQDRIIDLFLE